MSEEGQQQEDIFQLKLEEVMKTMSGLKQENDEIKRMLQLHQNLNKKIVKSVIQNNEAFIAMSEIIEIEHFDPLTCASQIRELLKDNKDFDFFSLYPDNMSASLNTNNQAFNNVKQQLEQSVGTQLQAIDEIKENDQKSRIKFENMLQKFQQIESRFASINEDINNRAPRSDLKSVQESFKLLQAQLNTAINQMAEKELVMNILDRICLIEKQINKLVDKNFLYDEVGKMLAQSQEEALKNSKNLFITKDFFNKQQQIIYKEIHSNMDEFMSNKQFMMDLMKENKEKIEKSWLRIADKLDITEFKFYKEKNGNFISKQDIDDIYSAILPSVDIIKYESRHCIENMDKLLSQVQTVDEALLYRATKQDVEELELRMKEYCPKKEDINSYMLKLGQQVEQQLQRSENFFEGQVDQITQKITNEIDNSIIQLTNNTINQQFTHFNLPQMRQDIAVLKQKVETKASNTDLLTLNDQKTSKLNTEKIQEQESANYKKGEIEKSIVNMEQVYEWLNQNKFSQNINYYFEKIQFNQINNYVYQKKKKNKVMEFSEGYVLPNCNNIKTSTNMRTQQTHSPSSQIQQIDNTKKRSVSSLGIRNPSFRRLRKKSSNSNMIRPLICNTQFKPSTPVLDTSPSSNTCTIMDFSTKSVNNTSTHKYLNQTINDFYLN